MSYILCIDFGPNGPGRLQTTRTNICFATASDGTSSPRYTVVSQVQGDYYQFNKFTFEEPYLLVWLDQTSKVGSEISSIPDNSIEVTFSEADNKKFISYTASTGWKQEELPEFLR